MSSLRSKLSAFFVFSSLLVLSFQLPSAAAGFPANFCSESSDNYAKPSAFATNLDFLLSSLPSDAKPTGFATLPIGEDPNRVYGLAQCRADTTGDRCLNCLKNATELPGICPNKTGAIWYDNCLVRYSEKPISPSPDPAPALYSWDGSDVTDPTGFNLVLERLLSRLVSDAISVRSGARLYATDQEKFKSFQTVYGLVQCNDNLSPSDCDGCLNGTITKILECCGGKQGAWVVGLNCNCRYALNNKFYEDVVTGRKGRSSRTSTIIAIAVPLAVVLVLFLAIAFCFLRLRKKLPLTANPWRRIATPIDCVDQGVEGNESVHFDLESVRAATDNFSEENKLGEGGFGAVYKGGLSDGREIAVKRLSCNSRQGVPEFKTEAALVAKLQHKNLVRLLGFCVEGQEKLLIYEYVPNTSLDKFLFDPTKRESLDWGTRYRIIGGIARGLLYLHEDSPLKVFHRDLKASNVLLDAKMNPKISDFGLAKIFGEETHITLTRVAGTYGYMAPEYYVHRKFSAKSDVFSFGVLMLEIVTGQKNSSFYESDGAEYLLSYAWERWKDGRCLEVVDPTIRESCSRNEAMRCIHTALLCVQEDAVVRPTMSVVVLMLSSSSITLPAPSKPAFYISSRMTLDAATEVNSGTNETNRYWDAAIGVNLGTNESK